MTSIEENLNGRQPNGRQHQRKMPLMKDNFNGSGPQWKTNCAQVNLSLALLSPNLFTLTSSKVLNQILCLYSDEIKYTIYILKVNRSAKSVPIKVYVSKKKKLMHKFLQILYYKCVPRLSITVYFRNFLGAFLFLLA